MKAKVELPNKVQLLPGLELVLETNAYHIRPDKEDGEIWVSDDSDAALRKIRFRVLSKFSVHELAVINAQRLAERLVAPLLEEAHNQTFKVRVVTFDLQDCKVHGWDGCDYMI